MGNCHWMKNSASLLCYHPIKPAKRIKRVVRTSPLPHDHRGRPMAFPILLRNPKDRAMWYKYGNLGIKQQQQQHRHIYILIHITLARTHSHTLVHLLTNPTILTQTLTRPSIVHVHVHTTYEPFISTTTIKTRKPSFFSVPTLYYPEN